MKIFKKFQNFLIKLFIKEIWKDIKKPIDYTGYYQISNFGNVKSLDRTVKQGNRFIKRKGQTRKKTKDFYGYYMVSLTKYNICKVYHIHRLVWDHFSNKKRNGFVLTIDHKNEIKTDNRFVNLQLLTNRENCSKGRMKYNNTSKYTGVNWDKSRNKWQAKIRIKDKHINLGRFDSELKASEAYQYKLKEIND